MLDRRALLGLPMLATLPARAQGWPARPVSILVPFAAGGPTDLVARILADRLTARLGQTFIVDNRPGAGGDIAGHAVARAAPDGYTLLFSASGSLAVNRHIKPNPAFDPMRDLVPVSLGFKSDHAVVVANRVPAKTLAELLALGREKPDGLSYGSAGVGSATHLIAAYFLSMAGMKVRHVTYRGAGQAMNDLVAGHIDMMVDTIANSLPQVQAGNIRLLAMTGKERNAAVPDIPTAMEAGVPGYSAFAWGALLAPLKTPQDIVELLSREVRAGLAEKATAERFSAIGAEGVGTSPTETAAFMKAETDLWAKVVRDAGIKAE